MTHRCLLALVLALVAGCGGAPDPAPAPEGEGIAAVETPAAPAEATPSAAPAAAPPSQDRPDDALTLAAGSTLTFSARKNDEADVQGTFTALDGWLSIPDGDLGRASGVLGVDWSGLDTTNPARDMNIRLAFFAAPAPGPKGNVRLVGLRSDTARLEPGQQTTATAQLEASAGVATAQLEIPVTVERGLNGSFTLRSETGSISISSLGMDERKAALIALCQHTSIGDGVGLSGALTFGP